MRGDVSHQSFSKLLKPISIGQEKRRESLRGQSLKSLGESGGLPTNVAGFMSWNCSCKPRRLDICCCHWRDTLLVGARVDQRGRNWCVKKWVWFSLSSLSKSKPVFGLEVVVGNKVKCPGLEITPFAPGWRHKFASFLLHFAANSLSLKWQTLKMKLTANSFAVKVIQTMAAASAGFELLNESDAFFLPFPSATAAN